MPGSDATGRVSKPAGWGGEADGCGNLGRGFNLFKALRPILRASRERQIARARCVRPAAPKRGDGEEGLPRRREISGRGFNLFKALRPIFRALVACRSGGPNLSALMPRSDATASRLEAGSGRRRRRRLRQSRARIQPFQGLAPDFAGARRSRSGGPNPPPLARSDATRASRSGHGEERRPTAVAIPGAEFNLFKAFRPIFRALVACRSGGPNLFALMPRSDAKRRVSKRARAGSGVDVCGNPGRGINLFKALRPILRALVACRSGDRTSPSCEERRNASRREAGWGRQRRRRLWQSRARNQPFQGFRPISGRSSPAEAADRTSPPSCRGATQRVASRSRLHKAAAFELPEASFDRLGKRSGASWSRLPVSSRAARGSVGGGAGASGGAALRQADTGGVLCCQGRQNKSRTYFLP